jgi:hypothetical protein
MEEFEVVQQAVTQGPNWMMIISFIMNILLGGTSIFGLIKFISEKKLRKIGELKEEKNLDLQNFEALAKQIDYQEELLTKYAENKKKAEELEDERDRLIIQLKRNATDLELEKISLQKKLAIAESLVCKNTECKERKS